MTGVAVSAMPLVLVTLPAVTLEMASEDVVPVVADVRASVVPDPSTVTPAPS